MLSLVIPELGAWLKGLGVVPIFIVAIFLCQGASTDGRTFRRVKPYLKALTWGFVVAHALAPLLAWLAVRAMHWQGDDRVGFLLICCMAPTLVSGIVIATQADGDRATALILTVVLNLAAVLTIPFNLRWTLGADVALDQWALLRKLVLYILVPAGIGQAFRLVKPQVIARHPNILKYTPVLMLGATVFVSLSQQADNLRQLEMLKVVSLALPSLAVHYVLLVVAYAGARLALGLPRADCRSLAFVCSQKTIPVAVAVWSTEFADAYPLALLPPIIFHLSQIWGDGVVAQLWSRKAPLESDQNG